jgi:hypothetical protein
LAGGRDVANDEGGHDRIGRGFRPQISIDDLERSVWQFADHSRVDEHDLGQDAAEGVLLLFGVLSPVLGMGPKVSGPNAAQLLDAITDIHDGFPSRVRDG